MALTKENWTRTVEALERQMDSLAIQIATTSASLEKAKEEEAKF